MNSNMRWQQSAVKSLSIWNIYAAIMAFFELDSQTIKLAPDTFILKSSTAYHKPTTSRTRAIVSSALAFALTAP